MDLVSNRPYWSVKDGLPGIFPPLGRDETCDVAVMGAGISGSLVAESLTAAGHDVIVLDRRDVATGSTSASTALLQYEIDTHLTDLSDLYGREMARAAYRACYEAIDLLERLLPQANDESKAWVKHDSDFNSIRGHPRYQNVLKLIQ